MDHHGTDLLIHPTGDHLIERDITSVPVAEIAKNVDRSGIGHPRRAAERAKRLGVELHRQLASLVVGHPADAQPCVQLPESRCQASEVVIAAIRHEIDVAGPSGRSARMSTKPSDEHVLDPVTVECFKGTRWFELGFRRQPRAWLADD